MSDAVSILVRSAALAIVARDDPNAYLTLQALGVAPAATIVGVAR